jgi:xanthine dehydrogenase accessory factor
VQLLYVLQSEGSSPGRQGFKMAVAADGGFYGTIGGGIMEQKLVEKAKRLLLQRETNVLLQHQYHDKEHSKDQSGMICSGSQLNVFIPLKANDLQTINEILLSIQNRQQKAIQLSPAGIAIQSLQKQSFHFIDEKDWNYIEPLDQRLVIHIIGGGHVSLALSQVMNFLGFFVKVYDDRPELNTMLQNNFAHEKIIVSSYEKINEYIKDAENDFAVIITVGYRTDKVVLKQLLKNNFFYLGLMGSDKKIETLFSELEQEGISSELLKSIFSPIGINIFSKTTQEIAISIAAEIIKEKNKDLPTGRSKH